jgi:SOS-response transcriptional repressor LexA
MFEKLCDNLNFLMEEMRISADELGRRTQIPPSTIKKIRNRYNPNPTLTTLLPLAKFFSISLSQLVGDEPLPATRIQGQYSVNQETLHRVPVFSWQGITQPFATLETTQFISTENVYSEKAFALFVEEDDWENLTRGTALIIDPALQAIHRDFVIVHKEGQPNASLKQILFDDGHIYLKPIIQGYQISVMTPDHRILGVVVEYKKHLRNISAQARSVECI